MLRNKIITVAIMAACLVFVPVTAAQAADEPSELCPTLPPAQPVVPEGPAVETALMRTASLVEEADCEPGSMQFEIPLDVLIEVVEANGYDVVDQGLVDDVLLEYDSMALELDAKTQELSLKTWELNTNKYLVYVLDLLILGMAVLWILDRRRERNYLQ